MRFIEGLKRNDKVIIGLLVAILAVVAFNSYQIKSLFEAGIDLQPQKAEDQRQPSKQPSKIDMKTLSDNDPFKGDKNAKVTIVEFSDYQCPYCARFYSQTLPQIEENYIKSGKVKFVYRDYPLPFHQFAQKASEAAECAGDQEKYWEMHNKIFDNQQQLNIENLKYWAKELGLDGKEFDSCLDSGKYVSEVKEDIANGSAVGVTGTPTFIINGEIVSGAQPYEVFQQIIEAKLSE
ncbi:MAG: DsbA family protein [Candidatus Woesearchaeota archaeon]